MKPNEKGLTATSTVFSCPTRLISEVQVPLEITAAMNTYPLLFVAFDAVICAPSGDQLFKNKKRKGGYELIAIRV